MIDTVLFLPLTFVSVILSCAADTRTAPIVVRVVSTRLVSGGQFLMRCFWWSHWSHPRYHCSSSFVGWSLWLRFRPVWCLLRGGLFGREAREACWLRGKKALPRGSCRGLSEEAAKEGAQENTKFEEKQNEIDGGDAQVFVLGDTSTPLIPDTVAVEGASEKNQPKT